MKRLYLIIFLIGYIYSQNYTYVKPSRDGIGKIYMGREISGIMGHRGAGWLERSSRGYEERPDLVIKALKLDKSDIVADFGAGSGYFTKRLAPLCSLVYAVDIQKEMININKKRLYISDEICTLENFNLCFVYLKKLSKNFKMFWFNIR